MSKVGAAYVVVGEVLDLGAARGLKLRDAFEFIPGSAVGNPGGSPAGLLFNASGERLYLASSSAGPSIVGAFAVGAGGQWGEWGESL